MSIFVDGREADNHLVGTGRLNRNGTKVEGSQSFLNYYHFWSGRCVMKLHNRSAFEIGAKIKTVLIERKERRQNQERREGKENRFVFDDKHNDLFQGGAKEPTSNSGLLTRGDREQKGARYHNRREHTQEHTD